MIWDVDMYMSLPSYPGFSRLMYIPGIIQLCYKEAQQSARI